VSVSLAALERRAAAVAREARLLATPSAPRTAVAMAGDLGITLDPWQRGVLTTDASQILMLCARQSGKSLVAALLALHEAVYVPGSLTLILSPGERQSKLLLRRIVRLYGAMRGVVPAVTEGKLALELQNGSEVHALPGKEETVRGFASVDLLIEDEAAVVPDALYQAARPMLAVSGGRLVLLSTPRGKRGHFFHECVEGGPGWHRVTVTADQCPRIPAAWLAEERRRIGEWWYAQEYGCQFLDAVGQVFPTDLVQRALSPNVRPLFGG
jgi:hypothetical protein